ncbi:MAG: hypothetical protein ABI596_13525 [Pyrinomonadaceae bacterium]
MNIKKLFAPVLALMLMAFAGSLGITSAQTQDQTQSNALARGYRTGYSDGYAAGYQDAERRAVRDFKNKEEYQLANRNYASTHGSIDDYRDGYQQGFEGGYNSGFERRGFNSTVPDSLSRRGITSANSSDYPDNSADGTIPNPNTDSNVSSSGSSNPVISNSGNPNSMGRTVFIPRGTVMRVELLTNLSTDATQRGDRFQARVLEPGEFAGAMLDGRVTQVKRAGKLKGAAQLQLSFEQIRLSDNRWTNLSAQVIEVIPNQTSEGVGQVDSEGGVRGEGSTKSDVTKVGAATGIGAAIGAIAGGGKGAAIGAAIGAGIGTASVVTDEGKDIHLRQGQELRVRTANEVRIQ